METFSVLLASNAENISIWWRHNEVAVSQLHFLCNFNYFCYKLWCILDAALIKFWNKSEQYQTNHHGWCTATISNGIDWGDRAKPCVVCRVQKGIPSTGVPPPIVYVFMLNHCTHKSLIWSPTKSSTNCWHGTKWVMANESILFLQVYFRRILQINIFSTFCGIGLRWVPFNPSDYNSSLLQITTWCPRATSHYKPLKIEWK